WCSVVRWGWSGDGAGAPLEAERAAPARWPGASGRRRPARAARGSRRSRSPGDRAAARDVPALSVVWCAMDLVPALEEPLKKVLGPATAKVMAEHLGLHTDGDLLHHYPRRYHERGQLTHLADLPMDEHVTVVAQVADARQHSFSSSRA